MISVEKLPRKGMFHHTKGLFVDRYGSLYKSLEINKTEHALTNEYEILKSIQDLPEIVRIGTKVLTTEGWAFEIEPLICLSKKSKISLQDYDRCKKIAKELDARKIILYESPDLGIDTFKCLKLYDFSLSQFNSRYKDDSLITIRSYMKQYLTKKDAEYAYKIEEKELQEKTKKFFEKYNNR